MGDKKSIKILGKVTVLAIVTQMLCFYIYSNAALHYNQKVP